MELISNIDFDKYKDIDAEEEYVSVIKSDIEKLKDLLKQRVLSLDEYKANISLFEKKVMDMMTDCDDGSFYFLENKYSVGTEDTQWQTDGKFKSRVELEDCIDALNDRLGKYSEEEVSECMWWEITKYAGGTARQKLYTLYMSADMTVLGIEFESENMHLFSKAEAEVCTEYNREYNDGKSKTIVFPFEAGDVVKLNYFPYFDGYDNLVYSGFRDYFIAVCPKNKFFITKVTGYLKNEKKHGISFPERHLEKMLSSGNLSLRMVSAFLRENPKYFCEEENRKEANLCQFYSELMGENSNFIPTFSDKYSLDEYILLHKKFNSHFENYFAAPLDGDELYFVSLKSMKDKVDGVFEHTFGSFDRVCEYIQEEKYDRNLQGTEVWWQIERKKLVHGEYRTYSTLNMNVDGERISVSLKPCFKEFSNDPLVELLISYLPVMELYDNSVQIDLPFEIGDIICINIQPEGYKDYAIYLGKLNLNDKNNTHAGLIYDWKNKDKYSVVPLSCLDFKPNDKFSLYPFMDVVCSTGNHALSENFSKIIKRHPEVIEKLLEINEISTSEDIDEIAKYLNEYY